MRVCFCTYHVKITVKSIVWQLLNLFQRKCDVIQTYNFPLFVTMSSSLLIMLEHALNINAEKDGTSQLQAKVQVSEI